MLEQWQANVQMSQGVAGKVLNWKMISREDQQNQFLFSFFKVLDKSDFSPQPHPQQAHSLTDLILTC